MGIRSHVLEDAINETQAWYIEKRRDPNQANRLMLTKGMETFDYKDRSVWDPFTKHVKSCMCLHPA